MDVKVYTFCSIQLLGTFYCLGLKICFYNISYNFYIVLDLFFYIHIKYEEQLYFCSSKQESFVMQGGLLVWVVGLICLVNYSNELRCGQACGLSISMELLPNHHHMLSLLSPYPPHFIFMILFSSLPGSFHMQNSSYKSV